MAANANHVNDPVAAVTRAREIEAQLAQLTYPGGPINARRGRGTGRAALAQPVVVGDSQQGLAASDLERIAAQIESIETKIDTLNESLEGPITTIAIGTLALSLVANVLAGAGLCILLARSQRA